MNINVMIDIETLGTCHDAPIISIGAVTFVPDTGEIRDRFYIAIDLSSAIAHGTPSGETLRWWMDQSEEARRSTFFGTQSLESALSALQCWYQSNAKDAPVWANGPSFDISILEFAFRHCRIPIPWKYNAARDCRTIKSITDGMEVVIPQTVMSGSKHNALDDAIYQAQYVSAMWQHIRGVKA